MTAQTREELLAGLDRVDAGIDALKAENAALRAALERLVAFAIVALRHDIDIPGFDPETHVDVKAARAALKTGAAR